MRKSIYIVSQVRKNETSQGVEGVDRGSAPKPYTSAAEVFPNHSCKPVTFILSLVTLSLPQLSPLFYFPFLLLSLPPLCLEFFPHESFRVKHFFFFHRHYVFSSLSLPSLSLVSSVKFPPVARSSPLINTLDSHISLIIIPLALRFSLLSFLLLLFLPFSLAFGRLCFLSNLSLNILVILFCLVT